MRTLRHALILTAILVVAANVHAVPSRAGDMQLAQTKATTVAATAKNQNPPATTTTPAPTASNQYQTEAAAQQHCRSDTVVWVNTNTQVYHAKGNRYYGTTKKGAYMCKADADKMGARAAKNE